MKAKEGRREKMDENLKKRIEELMDMLIKDLACTPQEFTSFFREYSTTSPEMSKDHSKKLGGCMIFLSMMARNEGVKFTPNLVLDLDKCLLSMYNLGAQLRTQKTERKESETV